MTIGYRDYVKQGILEYLKKLDVKEFESIRLLTSHVASKFKVSETYAIRIIRPALKHPKMEGYTLHTELTDEMYRFISRHRKPNTRKVLGKIYIVNGTVNETRRKFKGARDGDKS